MAAHLRVKVDHVPYVGSLDNYEQTERMGITITNHHESLTFTGIDVVEQTDESPPRGIEHVGRLQPGESQQVFLDPEVHVRVIYKADYAGFWEITFADIDPEWGRVPAAE